MIPEYFHTIVKTSEGLYKDRGSKFIGIATPVINESEVKVVLDQLKKKYYDARHHCYAYVLDPNSGTYRANDDGEPSHSAGDPILGQIRSKDLTNCLVVVVRYFGGTKLGVPGLIAAYKGAAAEALENNQILRKYITEKISIRFNYPQMNEVMRMVKAMNLKIVHHKFEMECLIKLEIKPKERERIKQHLEAFPEILIDPTSD